MIDTQTDICDSDINMLLLGQQPDLNLDNFIRALGYLLLKGACEMAKINRTVMIGDTKKWIRANTEQEYADKLLALCGANMRTDKHPFKEYALNWFDLYSKPNIQSVTAITYKRQLDLYIIPALGDKAIEDISTDDIQRLFNSIHGAKATKNKVKVVLNMIFEMALDDGLILKNPLQSKRLKLTGTASEATKPYTIEQMQYLVKHIDDVQSASDRAYLFLQALHPLRLEEVLGLKWRDIDLKNKIIHIRQVATHPDRNQAEVKEPKTEASKRDIALSSAAEKYLHPGPEDDFVCGGEKPLSYIQVKHMCQRIKKDISFSENITPRRFRTTVLTDIYDTTKDAKATQASAGHTTSAMTFKYYVKGRTSSAQVASAVDAAYGVSTA